LRSVRGQCHTLQSSELAGGETDARARNVSRAARYQSVGAFVERHRGEAPRIEHDGFALRVRAVGEYVDAAAGEVRAHGDVELVGLAIGFSRLPTKVRRLDAVDVLAQ